MIYFLVGVGTGLVIGFVAGAIAGIDFVATEQPHLDSEIHEAVEPLS